VYPATLVCRSGQAERGGGKGKLAMEHLERPALVVSQVVIAHLQQSVQAWTDADRLLPEDSASLLAMLDHALGGLSQGNSPAARSGFEAFSGRVQGLVADGVLTPEDARPRMEAAAAMGALLPSAGERDR
jgi:hypothetical protein